MQLKVTALLGSSTVAGKKRARSSCLGRSCALVQLQKLTPTLCIPVRSKITKSSSAQYDGLTHGSPGSCPSWMRSPRAFNEQDSKKCSFQYYVQSESRCSVITLTKTYLYAMKGMVAMKTKYTGLAYQLTSKTILTQVQSLCALVRI